MTRVYYLKDGKRSFTTLPFETFTFTPDRCEPSAVFGNGSRRIVVPHSAIRHDNKPELPDTVLANWIGMVHIKVRGIRSFWREDDRIEFSASDAYEHALAVKREISLLPSGTTYRDEARSLALALIDVCCAASRDEQQGYFMGGRKYADRYLTPIIQVLREWEQTLHHASAE